MKKIIQGVCIMVVLFLATMAFAGNVNPTKAGNFLQWDLVNSVITTSSNTDVMIGDSNCKDYIMFIKVSGTVNMTADIHIRSGDDTTKDVTVTTYTLSSASTTGYIWSFPTPQLYVTFTITTGQVDDVYVICRKGV